MCDPPPLASDSSRIAAVDAELARISSAIKEEKRLALSLIQIINRRDATASIQLHAARLVIFTTPNP